MNEQGRGQCEIVESREVFDHFLNPVLLRSTNPITFFKLI